MKKTMSNIFDEAKANEIEKFVNQNAAPSVSADTLSSIKNKVYAKTGIIRTKNKKPFVLRWQTYAAAACLVLIVGGIFGAPSIMKLFNGVEPDDVDIPEFPADLGIDEILWADNCQSDTDPDSVNAFVEWNGWTVDYSLYDVLNRANDTDFIAVLVRKNNVDRDSFKYNGNTLSELQEKRDELGVLESKLIDFHKTGEWLKYGELIYTTGTPDGERWTKFHYDDTVSFYGEDFIAKYLVDGKVQTDLLNEDLLVCQKRLGEFNKEIDELKRIYQHNYVDDVKYTFARSGAWTVVRNEGVFIFVQKDELAGLKIDGKENYVLSLAKRSSYIGNIVYC